MSAISGDWRLGTPACSWLSVRVKVTRRQPKCRRNRPTEPWSWQARSRLARLQVPGGKWGCTCGCTCLSETGTILPVLPHTSEMQARATNVDRNKSDANATLTEYLFIHRTPFSERRGGSSLPPPAFGHKSALGLLTDSTGPRRASLLRTRVTMETSDLNLD